MTVIAAGDPEPAYEIPTALLLEAMERWLNYLESRHD